MLENIIVGIIIVLVVISTVIAFWLEYEGHE